MSFFLHTSSISITKHTYILKAHLPLEPSLIDEGKIFVTEHSHVSCVHRIEAVSEHLPHPFQFHRVLDTRLTYALGSLLRS